MKYELLQVIFLRLAIKCKKGETAVRLARAEKHQVPICPTITIYESRKKKPEIPSQLAFDTFTCDALICRRCRCESGFMLSNSSSNAECVQICPITKKISIACERGDVIC